MFLYYQLTEKIVNRLRGFRDIYGIDWYAMQYIYSKAHAILKNYGYSGIELPILESTDVFARTLGDTSDIVHKEMYTFKDRNDDSLTLRPEGTASLVRSAIENQFLQNLPQRFFYYGPMFRYERPQKGRYRQFYQLGIECFGIHDPYADVEVLKAGLDIIEAVGVTNYTLEINTLGDAEAKASFNKALVDYFTTFKDVLSEDNQSRLERNPLRILDSKEDQEIIQNAPSIMDYLTPDAKTYFETFCRFLEQLNIPFTINPKLVRGLDYYSHVIFEIKSDQLGAQDAFLAGGRYDALVEQMGGPETPAVGWAIGIDRLVLLLDHAKFEPTSPVVIVPFDDTCLLDALQLADILRKESIRCEISFKQKIAKDLKYAEKLNATLAVLIGPDEAREDSVSIKCLKQSVPNLMVKRDMALCYIQKLLNDAH